MIFAKIPGIWGDCWKMRMLAQIHKTHKTQMTHSLVYVWEERGHFVEMVRSIFLFGRIIYSAWQTFREPCVKKGHSSFGLKVCTKVLVSMLMGAASRCVICSDFSIARSRGRAFLFQQVLSSLRFRVWNKEKWAAMIMVMVSAQQTSFIPIAQDTVETQGLNNDMSILN